MSEPLADIKPSTHDAIWISTAELHVNNKNRDVFSNNEIFKQAKENGLNLSDTTIKQYISSHCVANARASPDTVRYLFRVHTATYRLYRPEDGYDDSRKNGRMIPIRETIPQKYRYLLDWYENEYCKKKVEFEEQLPWLINPPHRRIENNWKVEIPYEITQKLNLLRGDYVGFIETHNGRIQLQKMKITVQAQ